MSEVITLDSSDEESQPSAKKTPVKKMPALQRPPHQTAVSKRPIIPWLRTPVITSTSSLLPKIVGPNANPFANDFRNKVKEIVNKMQTGKPTHVRIQNPPNLKHLVGVNIQKIPILPQNTSNVIKGIVTSKKVNVPIRSAVPTANYQKKPIINSVINGLPAGITVTKTSASGISRTITTNKKPPPSKIYTVELDDDEDYLSVNSQVGMELPVEFDYVPPKSDVNIVVKSSSVIAQNGSAVDSKMKQEAIKTPTKENKEDSLNREETDPLGDSDPLKVSLSFYTPKKKDKPDPLTVVSSVIEILDSPAKLDTEDKNKYGIDRETKMKVEVLSPKKEIDLKVNDEDENKAAEEPVIRRVEVNVKLKPSDVIAVDEFVKKSRKRIIPVPVVEAERKISDNFQKLIDICFELDKSADMKKIVSKKLIGYYMAVHPSFTESKTFCKFVDGKVEEIANNPKTLFLFIKDVVDELSVRRVKNKKNAVEESKSPDGSKARDEDSEEEPSCSRSERNATDKKIYMLERAMRKLSKAIKKLEEKEVEDDDEENSAYLLADRCKSRLVRIYKKLCSLTGERDEAGGAGAVRGLSRLSLCGGRLPQLSAAVKAAAASKPHWFPDYRDVYNCVQHCAKEQGLAMKPDELQSSAREAFLEIGTMLQQRRRAKEYEDLSSTLGTQDDPADKDEELAARLQKNREAGKDKEMEIINKFAERQTNQNLIAEDVADGDEEKSEGSSDSEEEDGSEKEEDTPNTEEKSSDKSEKYSQKSSPKKADEKKATKSSNCGDELSDKTPQKLREICEYLKLEKLPKRMAEKRKFEEDSSSNHSVSSSLSLIELSSSDSQDSAPSKGDSKRKCNSDRNFKILETLRPNSAMSGINAIDDESSQSCSGFPDSAADSQTTGDTAEENNSNDAKPAATQPDKAEDGIPDSFITNEISDYSSPKNESEHAKDEKNTSIVDTMEVDESNDVQDSVGAAIQPDIAEVGMPVSFTPDKISSCSSVINESESAKDEKNTNIIDTLEVDDSNDVPDAVRAASQPDIAEVEMPVSYTPDEISSSSSAVYEGKSAIDEGNRTIIETMEVDDSNDVQDSTVEDKYSSSLCIVNEDECVKDIDNVGDQYTVIRNESLESLLNASSSAGSESNETQFENVKFLKTDLTQLNEIQIDNVESLSKEGIRKNVKSSINHSSQSDEILIENVESLKNDDRNSNEILIENVESLKNDEIQSDEILIENVESSKNDDMNSNEILIENVESLKNDETQSDRILIENVESLKNNDYRSEGICIENDKRSKDSINLDWEWADKISKEESHQIPEAKTGESVVEDDVDEDNSLLRVVGEQFTIGIDVIESVGFNLTDDASTEKNIAKKGATSVGSDCDVKFTPDEVVELSDDIVETVSKNDFNLLGANLNETVLNPVPFSNENLPSIDDICPSVYESEIDIVENDIAEIFL